MKHQINAYLARVVAVTVVFLAGAGYALIETKTIATYRRISADQYQKVLDVKDGVPGAQRAIESD